MRRPPRLVARTLTVTFGTVAFGAFVLAALGSVSLAKTTPEPALQELLGRQAV